MEEIIGIVVVEEAQDIQSQFAEFLDGRPRRPCASRVRVAVDAVSAQTGDLFNKYQESLVSQRN